MRVLIIEDEGRLAENVARSLRESAGYAVDVSLDGEEGAFMAESNPYDLVILDLMLPKVHGFEVCRMLKASPSTRHIPVFMLTAAASTENKVQGFRLGANDYMTKPFAMPELLARVESLLRDTRVSESSTP